MKLLRKKEPALDDLGSSWPIQTARNAEIRKYTVGKAHSGEEPKVATKAFAEVIVCVTHGST